MDGDLDQASQLAHEILDVRAGAAVDLGRVLPGEKRDRSVVCQVAGL
jgi:hypothetical protein